MRADGGVSGCGGTAILGLAVLSVLLVPARARAITGRAVIEFQGVRQNLRVTNPDGTTRLVSLNRQFWSQNYQLTQSDYVRPDLNLFWQLQLNDIAYQGVKLNQRTPYGLVRITHPVLGGSASYRPVTTTTAFTGPEGLQPLNTERRQETQLTAYLAPPRLPRLDLSWSRRHREGGGSEADQTGTNRNAQLTYAEGALGVHAGYGDQDLSGAGQATQTLERNYNAGTAYMLGVPGRRSIGLAYEFTGSRRESKAVDRSESHTATLSGQLRQSARSQWNLYYNLRRSLLYDQVSTDQTDSDGSLLYSFQASRAARLIAGGGVRSERFETSSGIMKYLTAVLSADGSWKNHLRGNAGVSHTTNWGVDRPVYSTQGYHVGTRLEFTRRLALDANMLVSANGDSAARSARYVTQAQAGAQITPFRTLVIRLSGRRYLFRADQPTVPDSLESP